MTSPSTVILSPHHDDAALSLGLTLLETTQSDAAVHVLNVFTVSAHAPHGAACGVEAISHLRATEDDAFVTHLPAAIAGDLGRRDAPLRGYAGFRFVHRRAFDEAERAEILELALQLRVWSGHDIYYVPLAVGSHIDHRIARAAAERAWSGAELRYYEDLPYGTLKPGRLDAALATLGSPPDAHVTGTQRSADDKRALLDCYESQLSERDRAAVVDHARVHGGERWWRRTR